MHAHLFKTPALATALIQWLVGERRLGRRPSRAGPATEGRARNR